MEKPAGNSRLEAVLSNEELNPLSKQKFRFLKTILSETNRSLSKSMKFVMSAVTLGVFDALGGGKNPIFPEIGDAIAQHLPSTIQYYVPLFGGNFYEGALLMADAGLVMWSLWDRRWRKRRNLLGALMTPAHAATMDYSSAAISAGKLDALPLNPGDYMWRYSAYHNTIMEKVVDFVNAPSHLIPGAIQGYDLAIYLAVAYTSIQAFISGYKHFKFKKRRDKKPYEKNCAH